MESSEELNGLVGHGDHEPPLDPHRRAGRKVLGISRSTAYASVHTGDIPSLRLGRRIVIATARLADKPGLHLGREGLVLE